MKNGSALWVSTSFGTRGGVSSFVRAMRTTALWDDWSIHHIATHRDGSAVVKVATFALGFAQFVFRIVFRRPAVVHLHTASYGSFARKSILAWIAFACRVPVVTHVHGAEFHVFHEKLPPLGKRFMMATLTRSDVVIALGSTWAQRLEHIAPQAHIAVVPNSVRPGHAVVQPEPGAPVEVVFLGAVGARKGVYTLLDAWAAVAASDTPARLTIAGDGEVEQARARVEELGIGNSVTVAGWLSADDAGKLLDRSHVLVLPSENEGQPMAILEAMSRGMCVVGTAVGGVPEMIGDGCGLIVPPRDPAALTDALESVVEQPVTRSETGRSALARVRSTYDLDGAACRLDEIYREVTQ